MVRRDESPTTPSRRTVEVAPTSVVRSMVRLLTALFEQAPGRAASVLVLSVVLVFVSGVSLVMLVPLLGVAGLDVGGGSIGQLAEIVASVLRAAGIGVSLPTVVLAYLFVVVVVAAVARAHSVRAVDLDQRFVLRLRMRLFDAITSSRWESFVQKPSSSFIHALASEVERVGGALSSVLGLMVKAFTAVLYFSLAVFVSPLTTMIVALFGGVLMALMARLTQAGRRRGEAVSRAYERMYSLVTEHLAGMRIIKSHGVEAPRSVRFRDGAGEAARAQTDVAWNQANLTFGLQTGGAVIMSGVFVIALGVFELPLASILLLLYLYARLVPLLTGLQRQVQQVMNLLPAVDRVEAMISWLEERGEPASAPGDADIPELRRSLRLDCVSFSYRGADATVVVHDVDLDVVAGCTTAIVGPSGGGKSTVADLVVGLLAPDRGRVLIDDEPLDGAHVAAWRRRVGYVNQDTFLFHDTIRANLTLVRPDATEPELLDALRAASASFVEVLPEGLDTIVGDRGVRLSGGERQRIALARAILRRPDLLVLDEATSALDPENERIIQEAIARMAGRQTLLVIAHRLASVRGADRIYVMEHGRVVESGTWDELVGRPTGRFRALCEAQGLLDSGARKTAKTAGATVG